MSNRRFTPRNKALMQMPYSRLPFESVSVKQKCSSVAVSAFSTCRISRSEKQNCGMSRNSFVIPVTLSGKYHSTLGFTGTRVVAELAEDEEDAVGKDPDDGASDADLAGACCCCASIQKNDSKSFAGTAEFIADFADSRLKNLADWLSDTVTYTNQPQPPPTTSASVNRECRSEGETQEASTDSSPPATIAKSSV
jgi:hypothetical protein